MKNAILIAGGTGNLGGKIINALLERGAEVRMVVRSDSDATKWATFEQRGVQVIPVDMSSVEELTKACTGVSCVVSALQGLHDVIVDTQARLLEAAVAAGVPRFIPSDYATDFTKIPVGANRNFDLRREFHTHLDKAPIAATTIFNGCFAELLAYNIPPLDANNKTIGYWGEDIDWHVDYSTMDDTAAYTAAAALDASTPRYLRIASFQISPKELVTLASELTKSTFSLAPMGSLDGLAAYIKSEREAHPDGENALYPDWQNAQYMHGMFSVHHDALDNNRYPDVTFTSAAQFLGAILH